MRFRARSHLASEASSAYAWHMAPGAFLSLCPPWESVRLVGPDEGIFPGCLRQLRVSPLRIPWWALHDEFVEGVQFRDVQQTGPCKRWAHRHRFESDGSTCWLNDEVDFELPLAPFSSLALPLMRAQFRAMFLYRHRVTADRLRTFSPTRGLRLAVTGSSGVIGRQLVPFLRVSGHQVLRLVRRAPAAADEVFWNPACADKIPQLEGLDGLIHLAGKGVLEGNFGARHRQEIWTSRVEATHNLVAGLNQLLHPPSVVLAASGIGVYGYQPEAVADELAPPGSDFLADVCQGWEAASLPLEARGIRRVLLRIAPVLSLGGGALPPLYATCLCGPSWQIGKGQQPFSWVAMEDVLGMIAVALQNERWQGAVNVVSPQSTSLGVCAAAVATTLGGRPHVSVPEGAMRWLLGQRAPLLLEGCRAYPARALDWGYEFRYPELMGCLRHSLGRYVGVDHPPGWSFDWG